MAFLVNECYAGRWYLIDSLNESLDKMPEPRQHIIVGVTKMVASSVTITVVCLKTEDFFLDPLSSLSAKIIGIGTSATMFYSGLEEFVKGIKMYEVGLPPLKSSHSAA